MTTQDRATLNSTEQAEFLLIDSPDEFGHLWCHAVLHVPAVGTFNLGRYSYTLKEGAEAEAYRCSFRSLESFDRSAWEYNLYWDIDRATVNQILEAVFPGEQPENADQAAFELYGGWAD